MQGITQSYCCYSVWASIIALHQGFGLILRNIALHQCSASVPSISAPSATSHMQHPICNIPYATPQTTNQWSITCWGPKPIEQSKAYLNRPGHAWSILAVWPIHIHKASSLNESLASLIQLDIWEATQDPGARTQGPKEEEGVKQCCEL